MENRNSIHCFLYKHRSITIEIIPPPEWVPRKSYLVYINQIFSLNTIASTENRQQTLEMYSYCVRKYKSNFKNSL